MSCLHIAASAWTSLFCVLLVVLLFAGCNESDSIARAFESKYPSRRHGRSLRSLDCLERSEKNVKIGSRVTLIADRQAFQNSFNNVPYIWNDAMTSLLGQTVTVVDRPQSGIFGLPKSDPSSNQPVWWYPFSVIACVKNNDATITTRTQPTATTNAEDKCLDVFFAIENYDSCCTNFGYMKKGREPVCHMASPCAKEGMQDPRCKVATTTKAPTTRTEPTATTNAEDKCLDVFFAIENYHACCTNFGYMKKGRELVCHFASPCAKGGMQDPRCKVATTNKAPTTRTQPTQEPDATTNAEASPSPSPRPSPSPGTRPSNKDKCLDVFFAIEYYDLCCTNFGYMKKGREPVCHMASPCAKEGMQDPRCKVPTKAPAPTTKYSDYHYGSGYRYHRTPERRDYISSWEQHQYESSKHACSVLAGFEVPALALMICLSITTALSAHLLRKIEQTQPEIELLPAGKMTVVQASCEGTVASIKVNVVDDYE